jgi:hypothetical protein
VRDGGHKILYTVCKGGKINFTGIAKVKERKYVKQVNSKYKINNKQTKVNNIDKNK